MHERARYPGPVRRGSRPGAHRFAPAPIACSRRRPGLHGTSLHLVCVNLHPQRDSVNGVPRQSMRLALTPHTAERAVTVAARDRLALIATPTDRSSPPGEERFVGKAKQEKSRPRAAFLGNHIAQRFENCLRRRALWRPTFLRSTSRASRVTRPAFFRAGLREES